METFDGHVQVNRYDAEGLRHELEEDGKLVQFIYRGDEIVMEKTDDDIIRLICGYVSYLNGGHTHNNAYLPGSVRLDVFDVAARQVYDYKLVVNPGRGLSKGQIKKILRIGPGNLTSADIHEVNPR